MYHFNHLGSTTLITDEQGKVIETFDYNPYEELLDGEIVSLNEERSSEVDIKRFMNQDVIVGSVESSPSLNRYAYVEGNPVNYLDPFGLEKWEGEHDWWHACLGDISYVGSFLTLLAPFYPVLFVAKVIGEFATLIDMGLHIVEASHYPIGSRYYLYHINGIIVDVVSNKKSVE